MISPQDCLAGQWIGTSEGDVVARVILDLDDGPANVRGTGRAFFSDGSPGTICELEVPRDATDFTLEDVPLYWMPPGQAAMISVDQARSSFPGIEFPETAHIRLQRQGDHGLNVTWETNISTNGGATLLRCPADAASELSARKMSWTEFKAFALQSTAGSFIFRGQPAPYKLRTAFHRTYRKDLVRYVAEDIAVAHKQLTARTKHLFDLSKPQEQGAFWNLLQHHGYPTPLLDWTFSPFVAAFFAYRRRKAHDDKSECVRIFSFNKELWTKSFNQLDVVNFANPHFSILDALAIENPRAIPQQAISTLTNIDDVESYIHDREVEKDCSFIYAIDLEADLRPHIMAELSLMGITAGSLFPGLDGACEELMGRHFHHQVPPLQG